jgi:hypothetical protein
MIYIVTEEVSSTAPREADRILLRPPRQVDAKVTQEFVQERAKALCLPVDTRV